ncbi:putative secreted protein (Por secretion system target) [Tenacibaculum adriaticum]|uniref:Putative secreted protein (Por secretion system target) n=1 Tax=Tenacibaculum adriaticum TaxID=413713 RepID=A0A5S5DUD2_9FLAO|nr:zinc-dependent metalloprotease family protein [Tenacibaculum adriaticum]TYP99497.1 putative secreted protein (Por secretion system target) [Tenacibaculum adriaticum]
MKKITLLAFFMLSLCINAQELWKKTKGNENINGISTHKLDSDNFTIVNLNLLKFKSLITNCPKRGLTSGNLVTIPDEKGNIERFEIFENPILAPSLAAKYPEIKSYIGVNKKNGATLRMSVSQKGVQTMVSYKNKPTVFIQPVENSTEKYVVYNRLSKTSLPKEEFICSTADEIVSKDNIKDSYSRDANDQTLRKFRLAMSVNGEYTTYHGGTVAGALAAINATITRVNAVFETDMAVTFEVQDFPELIYTDPATDPYSGSLSAWNVELQNTLTNTIGNDAYDIGHMFGASGGGGNAGCIGCVCVDDTTSINDENKGAGITSPANAIPEGDTFDIDYVAHEIGHQMGANHTFSHNTEGTGVNAEPGSGSTIMGYAGITGSNVQQNSDPYFHYHSIRQILTNLETQTCWQNNSPINLTNSPPVANAGNDYIIPGGTAFVLRGDATDADSSDNLMYCWEQTDSGQVTASQFGPTREVGAQARSLSPSPDSDRYIPKLSRVIAGQLTETNPSSGDDWETVSLVDRELNWALTVRDREPTALGLGGQTSYDTMKITVDTTAGPFIITSQTTNELWDVGSTQTVTWDVAGTDSGAVNTTTVNIKMSVDGGITFPYILASNVPNDGSHEIITPATGGDTTSARIMVEGNDNIFYAVNSSNFSTQESEFALTIDNPTLDVCKPNDAVYQFTYKTFLGFTGTTTFSADNLPAGATITFNPVSAVDNNTQVTATITTTDAAKASYPIILKGTSGSIVKSINATLNIFDDSFDQLTLTSPTDGITGELLSPLLNWVEDNNATSYDIELAIDSNFASIVANGNVTTNSYTVPTILEYTTRYYWRVKPKNNCGEGSFSNIFNFTTEEPSYCSSTFTQSNGSEYISNVTFNTINNDSGNDHDPDADDGYQDFTNISTIVQSGETYQVSVTFDAKTFRDHCFVFIDWNQDYVFNIDDERYDLGTISGSIVTGTMDITVPENAVNGSTRMRVIIEYTNPNEDSYGEGACDEDQGSEWGETEDYTIVVDNPASVKDFSFNSFSLYPNPSEGKFNLRFEVLNTNKVSLKLFDIRGRMIEQKDYKNTSSIFSEELTFDKINAGLYLLQIQNGNKQTTKKLIIK